MKEELSKLLSNVLHYGVTSLNDYYSLCGITDCTSGEPEQIMDYYIDGFISECGEFAGKMAKLQLSDMMGKGEKAHQCSVDAYDELGDMAWYAFRIIAMFAKHNTSRINHFTDILSGDIHHVDKNHGEFRDTFGRLSSRYVATQASSLAMMLTDENYKSIVSVSDEEFGTVCGAISQALSTAYSALFNASSRASEIAGYAIIHHSFNNILTRNIKKLNKRLSSNMIIGNGDNRQESK